MERLKTSIEKLRQSLVRLEMAIESDQARRIQTETRAVELQKALKIAHDRLNNAVLLYRQGGQ
jgi:hypothetical protein